MEQPPAGKALVYVIEEMPGAGLFTTHVKVGLDGTWVSQLESESFASFAVDPGVHHLCAAYQGQLITSAVGAVILHRLNAEAGKTYYLVYRGLINRDSDGSGFVGFFDEVDGDEGRYLLQSSGQITSEVKK
jgi:hypothetical protein